MKLSRNPNPINGIPVATPKASRVGISGSNLLSCGFTLRNIRSACKAAFNSPLRHHNRDQKVICPQHGGCNLFIGGLFTCYIYSYTRDVIETVSLLISVGQVDAIFQQMWHTKLD
jgi:hypothetical protein